VLVEELNDLVETGHHRDVKGPQFLLRALRRFDAGDGIDVGTANVNAPFGLRIPTW
jgi:hypothetical protein